MVIDNTGSVHTSPSGTIVITNFIGEEVGAIELAPWFVLPQSVRTRELSWDRELLFGRYQAELTIDHGYDTPTESLTYAFWVLPWKVVAVTLAGLFIFFLLPVSSSVNLNLT